LSRSASRRASANAAAERAAAPILVVTGMAREASCAAGEGLTTICSGADVAALGAALDALGEAPFSCVVSFGFAGGLDYALRPGDVVVGVEAATDDVRLSAHPRLAEIFTEGFESAGVTIARGAVAGVDRPVMDSAAKMALRDAVGAVAVDMESHVAARFAAARNLPFAIVRAVSDPAARALPPLAASAITPQGGVDLAHILRELRREPAQLADLMRAGADARAAFAALGRCGPLLGPLARLVLADL